MDDKIRFVSGCLRTWYVAKRWFPKDGVRRVVSNSIMVDNYATFLSCTVVVQV